MIKFSNTQNSFTVNNIFVDKFLCDANGSFVKVYLYTLRHALKSDISISKIASDLNLLESDVVRAFKYWNKAGVIKFKHYSDDDYSVEFLNLSDLPHEDKDGRDSAAADNTEKFETKSSARTSTLPTAVMYTKSDINNYMKNNDGIRHMFLISSQLLNRALSDTDRKIIFSFYDYLKLPVEVIFTLLEYCVSIGKTNMRYIEKVAYTWADSEINTLAKASNFVKEQTEVSKLSKKYKDMFKITGRDLTETEETMLKSWIYELKASDEMIKSAYETTVANTGKIAFKYMDAVLRNTFEPKKSNVSYSAARKERPQSKNAFQNYDENDITDFDLKIMKDRLNKSVGEYEG